MPPKVKITKEDIVQTAVDIVRKDGAAALNARTLAAALRCSTQPIFSNFASMEELRLAVVEQADALWQRYMQQEIASGKFPSYKATGMAYIRFAKEEKELFKLLYMRDRSGEKIPQESTQIQQMEAMIHNGAGIDDAYLKLFHLEMWAYVHGIAVMLATSYFDLDWELISKMLTDCYQGLIRQFEKKE